MAGKSKKKKIFPLKESKLRKNNIHSRKLSITKNMIRKLTVLFFKASNLGKAAFQQKLYIKKASDTVSNK